MSRSIVCSNRIAAEDARAVERRVGDDPGPHRVDEVEHLVVGAVAALGDAVLGQRLRGAAAALVQGREEAAAGADPVPLLGVHEGSMPLPAATNPAPVGPQILIPPASSRPDRRAREGLGCRGRG